MLPQRERTARAKITNFVLTGQEEKEPLLIPKVHEAQNNRFIAQCQSNTRISAAYLHGGTTF
jgi:hypothetical protein